MKLSKTILLYGLIFSAFSTLTQADDTFTTCEQYAKSAWFKNGESPYDATHPLCANASVASDPHITTFSGLTFSGVHYDHNFPGDYTVMEAWTDNHFTILGRFVVDKAKRISAFTTTEAFKFVWSSNNPHSIEIHRGDNNAVIFIDGKVTPLRNHKTVLIPEVGYISRKDASYFIADTSSDAVAVVNANRFYLDLNVTIPRNTHTVGLLGLTFGPALLGRDNNVELSISPTEYDAVHGQVVPKVDRADFISFINSWLLTDANHFTTDVLPEIPNYDAKIYTLADLNSRRMERAKLQCETLQARHFERFDLQNCLFDMGFGGVKFARSVNRHQYSPLRLEVLQ